MELMFNWLQYYNRFDHSLDLQIVVSCLPLPFQMAIVSQQLHATFASARPITATLIAHRRYTIHLSCMSVCLFVYTKCRIESTKYNAQCTHNIYNFYCAFMRFAHFIYSLLLVIVCFCCVYARLFMGLGFLCMWL